MSIHANDIHALPIIPTEIVFRPAGAPPYLVREGDTLSGIAARLNVREDHLRAANGFPPDDLSRDLAAGEQLVVPSLADGVAIHLAPLEDHEYFRVNETSVIEGDVVRYQFSRVPGLFETKLIRVTGCTFGGREFDRRNPDHVRSIPMGWRVQALMYLMQYASGRLTEEERGN